MKTLHKEAFQKYLDIAKARLWLNHKVEGAKIASDFMTKLYSGETLHLTNNPDFVFEWNDKSYFILVTKHRDYHLLVKFVEQEGLKFEYLKTFEFELKENASDIETLKALFQTIGGVL